MSRMSRFIEQSRCPYCMSAISPTNYSDYHKGGKCTRRTTYYQQIPLTIQQIMLTYFMQPTQQTLEDAIKGITEVFLSEEETFSIYGITLSLRDLINQGWIRIDGLTAARKPIDAEDDSSMLVDSQELPHSLVRETFNRLYQNGDLDCAVNSRGKFTTYGDPFKVYPVTNVSPPTTPYPQVTSPFVTKPSVDELTDKIVSYLQNKGEATLKQIQSRLKTKGITCKDIGDALNKVSEVVLEAKSDLSKFVAKIK